MTVTPHTSSVHGTTGWAIALPATTAHTMRYMVVDDDELRELRDAIDKAAPTQTSMEIPA